MWYLIACIPQASEMSLISSNTGITNGLSPEEAELLALTNKEREHVGLEPLNINRQLMCAAREQSASMARKNHLSHTVNGKNFTYRIKKTGYPFVKVGENVARSKRSLVHVVKLWMKSPGHRRNILNSQFKGIGSGITRTQHGDKYFAEVFGAQK